MRNIIIDFNELNRYEKLNKFLWDELDLQSRMNWKYGYNLSAFWDMYWYSDESDFFILKNYNSIKDKDYKEQVDAFISILNDLKWFESVDGWSIPNPNFDYKIES